MENLELKKSLGSVFTVQEIAAHLRVDKKWVYEHYEKLGGLRIGGRILFFENRIVQVVEKEDCHAISEEEQMDRMCETARRSTGENFPDPTRRSGLGSQAKGDTLRKLRREDRHGVFDGAMGE